MCTHTLGFLGEMKYRGYTGHMMSIKCVGRDNNEIYKFMCEKDIVRTVWAFAEWFHHVHFSCHYYSIAQDFTTSNGLVLPITQSTDLSYHQLITSNGVLIRVNKWTIPVNPDEV